MFEIIEADFPPLAEPAFRTPGEAVDYAKFVNSTRRDEDIAECVGRRIDSAHWGADFLELHLSNQKTLNFRCARFAINLTLDDAGLRGEPTETGMEAMALIHIAGKEITWKRGPLADGLRGKTIIGIHASQTGFFLDVTGAGTLALNVLRDRRSGRPLLFWELSD